MKRERLSSSSVASAGYDLATHTLELEFLHGGVYQYFLVPEATYRALLAAPSAGRFVAEKIKPRHPCRKV